MIPRNARPPGIRPWGFCCTKISLCIVLMKYLCQLSSVECTIQADDLYRTLDHSSGKNGTDDQDSNTHQSRGR